MSRHLLLWCVVCAVVFFFSHIPPPPEGWMVVLDNARIQKRAMRKKEVMGSLGQTPWVYFWVCCWKSPGVLIWGGIRFKKNLCRWFFLIFSAGSQACCFFETKNSALIKKPGVLFGIVPKTPEGLILNPNLLIFAKNLQGGLFWGGSYVRGFTKCFTKASFRMT